MIWMVEMNADENFSEFIKRMTKHEVATKNQRQITQWSG